MQQRWHKRWEVQSHILGSCDSAFLEVDSKPKSLPQVYQTWAQAQLIEITNPCLQGLWAPCFSSGVSLLLPLLPPPKAEELVRELLCSKETCLGLLLLFFFFFLFLHFQFSLIWLIMSAKKPTIAIEVQKTYYSPICSFYETARILDHAGILEPSTQAPSSLVQPCRMRISAHPRQTLQN